MCRREGGSGRSAGQILLICSLHLRYYDRCVFPEAGGGAGHHPRSSSGSLRGIITFQPLPLFFDAQRIPDGPKSPCGFLILIFIPPPPPPLRLACS